MLEKQIELHLQYLGRLESALHYGNKLDRKTRKVINVTITEVIHELDILCEKFRQNKIS